MQNTTYIFKHKNKGRLVEWLYFPFLFMSEP